MGFYNTSSFLKSVVGYCRGSEAVSRLLQDGLIGRTKAGVPWVFRADTDPAPPVKVESSGKVAVVFTYIDDWAPQSLMHTLMFPKLRMYIWADRSRDGAGLPTGNNAADNARKVFDELHPLFHDPANRIHSFGDFSVISTVGAQGIAFTDIEDGDGSVRGEVIYDVTI